MLNDMNQHYEITIKKLVNEFYHETGIYKNLSNGLILIKKIFLELMNILDLVISCVSIQLEL